MALPLPQLPPDLAPPTAGGAAPSIGWPDQAELIRWCHELNGPTAAILIALGVVYLAFGYWSFRAFMMLNFACLGAWFGTWAGGRYGQPVPAAIVSAIVLGALCWPLMKGAVSLTGVIFGAILGVYVWRAYGLDPGFGWAGGAIGAVFLGMLAFSVFKGSVIAFTSLQGATMLVFGLLGLLYKYPDLGPRLDATLAAWPYALPLAVFLPAVVGLLYQGSTNKAPAK